MKFKKNFLYFDICSVIAVGILILLSHWFIFLVVPNERMMGPVQRIFYFHVGSAIACYSAFGILLIGSMIFLSNRNRIADCVARSAGEIAFLFATLVLLSGMIWGKSAWNTWFRWEPRLVSFLLLWMISLAYNLLRTFEPGDRSATRGAVIGIVGAISVPLVVFSIRLFPGLVQLHPVVVENRGLRDSSFVQGMVISMVAIILLQLFLIWFRARIEWLERSCGENYEYST